ncbi:MAG: AMP-binding protein [Bacteroidales bacterium]|nr:AMP-binding protein [Bacteroidales bacterium]
MEKNEIKALLGDILPAVDFDADFLFAELDSLSVATILYALSRKYGVQLDAGDVTPRNFKNLEALAAMVGRKMTLEGRIQQHAATQPDKPAVICGSESVSYAQLWDAILQKAETLSAAGLKPRQAYVYRANQDIDFIVTYCAVHYLKAVAVPLEHFATEENFEAVRREVASYDFPDGVADTLYTTGTTGKSKGVMLSETCLQACAENFIVDLHFNGDLLFIISGPLNHIASLFKIHPTLTAGGTICILDGLRDMNAFFKVFELPFEKFATFMVPASIRLLMQFSYERLCALAPKIAFIETGAAPITRAEMEQLSKALPYSKLYNTYGGTEIGCVATYDFNDGKYMEGCIGRPLKNASVEISPEGTIVVSGLTVMSGYVNDVESTEKVIVDGKVHMSDLGYFDENGLIHLTGRQGDVMNVGGYKVNPLEVESAAAGFPGLKDCLCCVAGHPVIGPVLKLLVEYDGEQPFDKHALAVWLKSRLEPFKVPVMYELVDAIRYTYNGKKDRKAYK